MPAIDGRDSSESSTTNIGLILGIVVGAIVLVIVLIALLIPILKQRREARNQPRRSTLEEFMGKAERETAYLGHNKSESTGPLLEDAPNWAPGGRQPRIQLSDLPTLPANVGNNYDDEDELQLSPQMQTGPASYIRETPPGLRLSIPYSAPMPASKGLYQPPAQHAASPSSPGSSDSESLYSQRSASTYRMQTVDLASPPPPVPPLPEHLRRASLPEEESPLARGNTIIVANLLKSRAKRLAQAPERSDTRTSRIERADSIKEAPDSGVQPEERRRKRRPRTRPPPLPTETLSVDSDGSYAETLKYYTSQPIGLAARSPDETSSLSSDGTIRPTKSAL
ncbi:hypothetical protein B0H11DRAFT_782359 [Mycena galericulata]|nr:hypothetical protein B0H11DRAFT_782359 [Mycena galericulata]